MKIGIQNTSSPGASFTDNTNGVLLKTYEWITEHSGVTMPFRDFRMSLQRDKGVNDNNNRNIYPLLKNGGLVNYEKGGYLKVDNFFTNTGLAYVKALQAKSLLSNQGYTRQQIAEAERKFDIILSEIVCKALQRIVKQPDVNYVEPFQDLIRFLVRYGRISKLEYAYLLYVRKDQDIESALDSISDQIAAHRANRLDFEVEVEVRNDIELREMTNNKKRKEGLSFLTSYGYFIGLLQQAGLVIKDDKYHVVVTKKESLLRGLGGM